MKKLKSKLCIILSALACLCFGIVAVMQLAPATVDTSAAVEGYSTTDFKMLDKGSVRKDLEHNGLRFATFIGDSSAQAGYDFVNDYELGTLFLPKEAIEGDAKLTIDGTYKNGIKAIAAVFDGDASKLITDGTYTGGKLFNAVIELTDFANSEQALNGKIVARTYVKNKANGQVTYCDAVERSAAYVAAKALDAAEDDTNGTLSTYLSYVEVVSPKNFNLGAWGDKVAAPKTNVEDIPVTYTVAQGHSAQAGVYTQNLMTTQLAKVANGMIEPLGEGDCTLTVTAAGGAITKDVPLTISYPQVAFFGGDYNGADNYFTIRCKNVASIEFEGKTVDASKWTYTTTVDHNLPEYNTQAKWMAHEYVLKIKKSDLLGDKVAIEGDYAVTIVAKDGYQSVVPIYVREAVSKANFADDTSNHGYAKLICLEGRLSHFGLAGAYFDKNSNLVIPMLAYNYARFNFNNEYVKAFFAKYPTAEKIEFKWGANNQANDSEPIKFSYKYWNWQTSITTGYATSIIPGTYTHHHVYQGMLYNGTVKTSLVGDENVALTFDPGSGTASGYVTNFILCSAYKAGIYKVETDFMVKPGDWDSVWGN